MNRYSLFVILILLACFSCGPQSKKTYSDTGELLSEDWYDQSCDCHRVTRYYPNRKVLNIATYDAGGLNGEDVVFAENGDTLLRYFWKNSVPDGRIYSYHRNGKLAYEHFYANKYKTGTWKYYDEAGKLTQEIIYEPQQVLWNNALENAVYHYFYQDSLICTETWKDGYITKTNIHQPLLYRKWAVEAKAGATLFKQNCARCHNLKNDLVGPALAGVTERRQKNWLISMVQNGDSLQKSGDKTAKELYDAWNYKSHPPFRHLSKHEIEAIFDYIENPTEQTPKNVDSVVACR